MNDHARIEELLAARALGGLEPEDEEALARERAAHGPACEECARLERGFAEAAGALAFALDPVPVRERLEDEVVARAAARRPPRGGAGAGPEPDRAERRGPEPRRLDRRSFGGRRPEPLARPLVRRLAALGAAAALVAAGWVLRDLTRPPVQAGGAFTVVRFEGAGEGVLAVTFRPGEPAYLLGAGLPAPPEGKRYELWLVRDGRPTSAGCFAPVEGAVEVRLSADVPSADLLAVTVEPAACPDAPTSEPILTAPLRAV